MADITPKPQEVTAALATNVSFNQQVAATDQALQQRNDATKNARAKWLALVAFLDTHSSSLPRRRGTVDTAFTAIKGITVYKTKTVTEDEIAALQEEYRSAEVIGSNYRVNNILEHDEVVEAIEVKFPGLEKFLRDERTRFRVASKALQKANKQPGVDTKATAKAKEEATKLAEAFAEAMEKLEDTADILTGVKDYIGVVEQIANISAIANNGKE